MTSDTTLPTAGELVAQVRTMHAELAAVRRTADETAEVTRRLAADAAERWQRIEERLAASRMVERQPYGREADLVQVIDHTRGVARAVTQTARVTWAGRQWDVTMPGLFDSPPVSPWHADIQRIVGARNVYRMATGAKASPKLDAELVSILARAPTVGGLRDAIERAWSDSAGAGAEWVPDNFVPALYEEFFVPNLVAALFPTTDIAGTVIAPKLSRGLRPYLKGRVTSDSPAQYTASTGESSQVTIDPAGFSARTIIDDALVEDAAIPLLPLMMQSIGRALADGYEDCVINGDTAATHQDAIASWNIRGRWGASGLGGAADHRRGFAGLRAIAYDRSCTVDLSAAQTAAGVMGSVIGAMGERAASDLVIITSPEVMFQRLVVDTQVMTIDKLGAAATLLTGQVASIAGHPVVMSRWVSADLAATGLYTGSGAYSGLLAVDRSAFGNYQRRGAVVEMSRDITIGAYNVVGTLRRTFRTVSGDTEKAAFYAYKML